MDSNSRIIKDLEANSIGGLNRNVDPANSLLGSLLSGQFFNSRDTGIVNFISQGNNSTSNQRNTTSGSTFTNSTTNGFRQVRTGNYVDPGVTGDSTIDKQLKKSIAMFDTNKDGFVSLDEAFNYLIGVKSRGQNPVQQIFQASSQARAILKSIDAFDQNSNTSISDTELINGLLQLHSGQYSNEIVEQIAKFVLGRLNSNTAGMDNAVKLIDTNPDRTISNLEVLNALMASRQGIIDINDPNINKLLKTNSNFDRLLAALNNFGDFNGEVSDQDAFQILLDLRKPVIDDLTISRALFLPFNHNTEAINHSIELLDAQADGQITDSEFVDVMMKIRHGELSSDENKIVLNILDNIPRYKNLKDIIVALDSNPDGRISDDELIDFTLGNFRNHITVDQELVDAVAHSNDKASIIKSLINKSDADHNGDISNQEYLAAITDLDNRNLSLNAIAVLNKILSRNPNHKAIEAALSFVDQNQDSIISDAEVSRAILANYRGEASTLDPDIFNMVLESNVHKPTIEAILSVLNPKKDGNVNLDDILSLVTKFKKGTFTADDAIFRSVLSSLPNGKNTINAYELIDADHDNILTLREYTVALMQMRKDDTLNPGDAVLTKFTSIITNANVVKDAIGIIDSNKNGIVSAQEFTDNFMKAVSDSAGKLDLFKLSVLSPLMDIIFPGAGALDQFRKDVDVNSDNIISDNELIDAVLKLNSGTISNPGQDIIDVVLSTNPHRVEILNLISTIDEDKDGNISNSELTNNLMKARRGGFSTNDPGLVQAILNKNSNFNKIQSVINIFDPDQNGKISDIEMFVALMTQRNNTNGIVFIPEIVNLLKTMNPNTAAIEALINNIDPNNSGTVDYDELISVYLKINSGAMADVNTEIKRVLPGTNGIAYGDKAIKAETLLDSIDTNQDGQVSDLEIANILIANKKTNILSSYDPELIAAIFRTNPNKASIETLISSLDKDGDGDFSNTEVSQVLLAQFKNPNLYGANTSLVEAILSTHNSSYTYIKNLIASIDSDHDGSISNLEAMKSIVNEAKNVYTAADKILVDSIIDTNTNITAIRAAYTGFGININSPTLAVDLFGIWIDIQQGVRNGAYFPELVTALGKTSELNTLTTQFTNLDADHDGRINETEFGNLLVDVAKGIKSASAYQTLINYLLHDPKLAAVKAIIDLFGNNSDQSTLSALMLLWTPERKDLLNTSFIQSILTINPHSAAIQKILTLVDPMKTGVINNNTTMGYIYSLQVARYSTPQSDMRYDFNNDGIIDQKDFDTYTSFYQYVTNSSGGAPFVVK